MERKPATNAEEEEKQFTDFLFGDLEEIAPVVLSPS